ncbi:uncharacterized protein Eint_111940 [Encephalitozoon intestinalis ATCC 50506]|uniref:Uncharacterized protein n=1 Tax=Encephalitozoon intestinalis (strain ATCC 50506) TaxID=876142 RepID=E0SA71_ENCIT|nr:uncharacterized protein Eint_111940 [Encephalitozoon intestinalis ATCC 50506]ADM12693.1 hypothetical protein Eint_111940 [Encephalitozoon intestinalis ATCC 50506]UTX46555.1 hypothetical protein GPK93_11g21670 [Encephalitozoon intestinalis]
MRALKCTCILSIKTILCIRGGFALFEFEDPPEDNLERFNGMTSMKILEFIKEQMEDIEQAVDDIINKSEERNEEEEDEDEEVDEMMEDEDGFESSKQKSILCENCSWATQTLEPCDICKEKRTLKELAYGLVCIGETLVSGEVQVWEVNEKIQFLIESILVKAIEEEKQEDTVSIMNIRTSQAAVVQAIVFLESLVGSLDIYS